MLRRLHVAEDTLQKFVDGELTWRKRARVEAHLAACWSCRTRKQDLEKSIADFVRLRDSSTRPMPIGGPRALLRARLRESGKAKRHGLWRYAVASAVAAAMLAVAVASLRTTTAPTPVVTVPNAELTPGATILASQQYVCRGAAPKNKLVPAALRKQVLKQYGIRNARLEAYEVDYLITPALGGADDIHNLWPQSSTAAAWNAQVKDALEDRLREMVCNGDVELEVAQRELATDWIAAYKKYFHTDRPLN